MRPGYVLRRFFGDPTTDKFAQGAAVAIGKRVLKIQISVERGERCGEFFGGVVLRPILRIGFFQNLRQFFLHFFGGLVIHRVLQVVQCAAFAPLTAQGA